MENVVRIERDSFSRTVHVCKDPLTEYILYSLGFDFPFVPIVLFSARFTIGTAEDLSFPRQLSLTRDIF